MRLLYRQTSILACLATLTVIVLVACSSGPGIAAPTVGEGAPGSVDFDAGQETETLALSEVFTGENLTFSDPKSSKPAVATASIANGTLTITAVSPGEATITVTATNAGGNVSHEIAVTVPATSAPAAPTVRVGAPDSVAFDRGQTTRTVSLNSVFTGENLTFADPRSSRPAVATASIANGILTITAVSSGSATITVTATNAGGNVSHQIAVTVPQTSAPAAPTVRVGAPDSVAFDRGQTTRTVSLNSVFTGENLTFADPRSSRPAVATASIANGILTITAVSSGSATITVTATNAGGNVSHQITVTATTTTNNPSTCRSPLTIERNRIAKCKLPSKATLESPPGDGVTVRRSTDADEADVWIIAAHKKGTYTVTIFSGTASPVKLGEITVVVPNSPPRRNTTPDPTTKITPTDSDNTYTAAISPNLSTYFTDADSDSLRYSIGMKPDSILIDANDGFVETDGGTLTFEVLEEVTKDFQVTIYANDDSGDKSQLPVVLTLGPADNAALSPRQVTIYSVAQKATGELSEESTLKVGPRLGVSHTVTFVGTGFVFAESESDKLIAAGKLSGHTVTTDVANDVHIMRQDGTYSPVLPDEEGDDGASNRASGMDYFIIESTGAVVLDGSTVTLGTDPSVTIQLKKGSSGRITIKYRVWALSSSTSSSTSKNSYERHLSVSVVTCNSPPDELADCP